MTRCCRGILLILIVSILFTCPLTASTRTIASVDRIPLGDWTYDAMMSLAADGLVPGHAARVFEGDRLFNRMQMAEALAPVIDLAETGTLTPSQFTLLKRLEQEFTPELTLVALGVEDDWSRAVAKNQTTHAIIPMGYVRATALDNDGDTGISIPFRASVFSNLTNHAFGLATVADKEDKFFQQLRSAPPTPDKLIVQGYDANFIWSLGRQYQNWGPAYSGSLIMSDNSIGFWQGRAAKEIDFGKLIGRVKITEFASVFEDEKRLYFFGRRYEKPLSESVYWGISETALTNKVPNPAILVLPFSAYKQLFGGNTDERMNTMYGTDLTYRTKAGAEVYGELLVNDLSDPRKMGYTLGFYVPKTRDGRFCSFRAEHTHVDRRTYETSNPGFPELEYVHNGSIIGSPIGPNANAIYLRAEHDLSPKWSLIGEYFNQRQAESGAPERPKEDVFSLMAAYDIAPDKSIALRVAPFRVTLPGEEAENGVRYEIRASLAF